MGEEEGEGVLIYENHLRSCFQNTIAVTNSILNFNIFSL